MLNQVQHDVALTTCEQLRIPFFVDSEIPPCYTLEDLEDGSLSGGVGRAVGVFSVGFGNYVSRERVVAVVGVDSSPIRRAIQESRKDGSLVDASQGRKTKSVLFMDDGRLVVSGLGPETLAKRIESPVGEDADADVG